MADKMAEKDELLIYLREREKELNCLYTIEEILGSRQISIEEALQRVVDVIPSGWQYPDVCAARIKYAGGVYVSNGFVETPWMLMEEIKHHQSIFGRVEVCYTQERPRADEGPFLRQERRLLRAIAERIGHFLTIKRLGEVLSEYELARREIEDHKEESWRIVLNLLRQTDRNLFLTVSRRMLNQLLWSGVLDVGLLSRKYNVGIGTDDQFLTEENRPYRKSALVMTDDLSEEIFKVAERHLGSEEILKLVRRWIQQDRLAFLARITDQRIPISEVVDAIKRYRHVLPEGTDLPENTRKGLRVALIRRLLSDQIDYIRRAKNFIDIEDFQEILDNIVLTPESFGKVGGKSAGLFLAKMVITKEAARTGRFSDIKFPRSWYLLSDGLMTFLNHNNLSEVVEQKYKEIDQIRLEYPNVVQTFKNAEFPAEIMQGLSVLLDEVGQSPLIVRSSSLLEDRVGSAFSGKYRSVFLANQGSKEERLYALTDAIAEVYASTFAPDPIQYRAERGLLDFYEEMAVMIQEVVGTRVGNYFMPTLAGVGFSRNEFRWSPRIRREDGVLRLVMGLGTRAVDRLSDDYPVLIAPGQPGLRVNVTPDEIARYSPKRIDLINLAANTFETREIRQILNEVGDQIPAIEKVVSIYDGQTVRKPFGRNIDFESGDLIVTFEGLVQDTDFVPKVKGLLDLLEEKLSVPVDIEFAFDGKDFYLLQCRPQSSTRGFEPAPIPKDVAKENIVFSAKRYITNGMVSDITHIVYVDPDQYQAIEDHSTLLQVGRAIGRLNKILPKRKFILMGPGRWGSLGDIKLGVRVTYADISNTAMLVEIARKKGQYVPDLSFGTHFFQDLVESGIRYLPLYPDEEDVIFNERFFKKSKNILAQIVPEFGKLCDVVKVIDVPEVADGKVLNIFMNADLDEAIGILGAPGIEIYSEKPTVEHDRSLKEDYWIWRLRMAERIASEVDPQRFGVVAMYVFGSTKAGTAGAHSDIDLLVHFRGNEQQKRDLLNWLDGWSKCLDELNYLKTGYRSGGLLDVHIVTDEDIEKRTSFAAKIDAVTDAARKLPLGKVTPGNKAKPR